MGVLDIAARPCDQGRGSVASSWCRQVWRPSVLTLLDAEGRHCKGTLREVARKFVVGGCPRLVPLLLADRAIGGCPRLAPLDLPQALLTGGHSVMPPTKKLTMTTGDRFSTLETQLGDMKRMVFRVFVMNKLRGVLQVALPFIAAVILVGCGKDHELDYGQPAAQFSAKDLPSKAKPYVGKKITVKGTVTRVDTSNQNSSRIYLEKGIECHLGRFKAMAASCQIGDTVFVDGFLKRCDDGDVLIEPALLRDPTAKFIAH